MLIVNKLMEMDHAASAGALAFLNTSSSCFPSCSYSTHNCTDLSLVWLTRSGFSVIWARCSICGYICENYLCLVTCPLRLSCNYAVEVRYIDRSSSSLLFICFYTDFIEEILDSTSAIWLLRLLLRFLRLICPILLSFVLSIREGPCLLLTTESLNNTVVLSMLCLWSGLWSLWKLSLLFLVIRVRLCNYVRPRGRRVDLVLLAEDNWLNLTSFLLHFNVYTD